MFSYTFRKSLICWIRNRTKTVGFSAFSVIRNDKL